jgi:asparagine synthase (glutamine-hydrolysing)
VEFAFSLPEEIRYLNGELKGLVRHAYRDVLPAPILTRGKRGFSMPAGYTPGHRRRLQELVLAELFDL